MTAEVTKRLVSEYSRVLSAMFEFMLNGGIHRDEILAISAHSLKIAQDRRHAVGKEISGDLATAALVLDAWHRNPRYLDPSAVPRAVPLLGASPSVEALIRSQRRQGAADLAKRFLTLGLVVPRGKGLFKPASEIALVSAQNPLTLQHLAKSLSTLLQTIGANLHSESHDGRLLERFAEVPDLPAEEVEAFQQFTKAQGWILLRTVNDWLETRRAKGHRVRKQSVRAGIHVHAYVAVGDTHHQHRFGKNARGPKRPQYPRRSEPSHSSD